MMYFLYSATKGIILSKKGHNRELISDNSNPKETPNNTHQSIQVKNILILIGTSLGEIDWILPVCHFIKKHYPEVKISVLFRTADSDKILRGNRVLSQLLSEGTHHLYEFKDFLPLFLQKLFRTIILKVYRNRRFFKFRPYIDKSIFSFFKLISYKKMIDEINPDVLLKDTTEDTFVRKKIILLARKRGCREVMFPHASELFNLPLPISPKYFANDILCNTKWMTKLFSDGNEVYKNKTHIVGIPRYDDWWIQKLLDYWDKHGYDDDIRNVKSPIFLLYTWGGNAWTYTTETAMRLIQELVFTILSYKNSFLIIKPHPRQNLEDLYQCLKQFPKDRWVIKQSQAMCLSSVADIVISMGRASVVLDSLAMGKLSIQYFKDIKKIHVDEYGKMGLAATAYTIDELKYWIDKIKSNHDKEREIFLENFRKIVPTSKNNATKKAVKVIIGSLGDIKSN